ncbi:unnamed protein product [Calicophoron daubneyi]|uniref:DM14 domain-containing protein n=1 Tax=Calicophoron daubneyi TaxID=300641 RepID=A0AAV2TV19_CALDB
MPRKSDRKHKNTPEFAQFLSDEPLQINEAELEGELLELLREDDSSKAVRQKRTLTALKAGEMDLNSDEPDEEVDENDPKLLAELAAFASDDKFTPEDSTPKPEERRTPQTPKPQMQGEYATMDLVNQRTCEYLIALEEVRERQPSDTSKIQRYEQILKQLESVGSRLTAGESVAIHSVPAAPPVSDIAPAGTVPASTSPANQPSTPPATPRAPEPPLPAVATPTPVPEPSSTPDTKLSASVAALKKREQEYKLAAIQARDAGQIARAKDLLMASKFIAEMLPKVESGEEPFDPTNDMPPPPSEFVGPEQEAESSAEFKEKAAERAAAPPAPQLPVDMRSPVVTRENLVGRMNYYQKKIEAIESDPSEASSKRRLQRIVNRYADALKAFDHNVSGFNYGELPPPPNCPKLSDTVGQAAGVNSAGPTAHSSGATTVPVAQNSGPRGQGSDKRQRIVSLLKTRQAELKAAAFEAKQSGNIELAKNYLRGVLTIKPMIESAEAGLPVDFSHLPRAPGAGGVAASSGVAAGSGVGPARRAQPQAFSGPIMTGITCDPPAELQLELEGALDERQQGQILIRVLNDQIKKATDAAQGLDRAGLSDLAQKAMELARFSKSTISVVESSITHHRPINPTFEWANIPQMNMNPDLGDDVLEVSVMRGISYPLPSEMSHAHQLDTYVELTLPFPSTDKPQKFAGEWVKHTCDPNYEGWSAKFQVNTKSRTYLRFIQNGRELKATVYYNRGVLRRVGVIGTASFPLSDLMHSATVNQLADLMDGRRAVGGRLEVRIRQRAPASGQQISTLRVPWLILSLSKLNTQKSASSTGLREAGNRTNAGSGEHVIEVGVRSNSSNHLSDQRQSPKQTQSDVPAAKTERTISNLPQPSAP